MKKILPLILFLTVLISFPVCAENLFYELAEKSIITQNELTKDLAKPISRGRFSKLVLESSKIAERTDTVYFKDTLNSEFKKEINTLYEKGAVKGDENSNFNPDALLTRAEAAAITGRLLNISQRGETDYFDNASIPDWSKYYIKGLTNGKIINGYDDNTVKPNEVLTFEDAFYLALKILKAEPYTPAGREEGAVYISSAQEFLNTSYSSGTKYILSGDIDFSGITDFKPIKEFKGELDGNGYSFVNIKIYAPENETFLIENNKGTLKNFYVKNMYAESKTAGLLWVNNGKVENVSVTGFLNGETVFGIANENRGSISGSMFSGRLSGRTASGICTENSGNIENSFADGTFSSPEASGISYSNNGNILNSVFMGEGDIYKICSYNDGIVKGCYVKSGGSSIKTNKGYADVSARNPVQLSNKGAYSSLSSDLWETGENGPYLKIDTEANLKENTDKFSGGNGTVKNPFKIVSPLQIENIRKFPSASFVFVNDADMSLVTKENSYKPIDNFGGFILGNGKEIKGIVSDGECAFINQNGGVVKNLKIGTNKYSGNTVSGLCLVNTGLISDFLNSGDISAIAASGICMSNKGIIANSVNIGSIKGNKISGICLENSGRISDCGVYGNLFGTGNDFSVFGISGSGGVYTSFNAGDLFSESENGIIFPITDGEYENSYFYDRKLTKQQGGLDFKKLTLKDSYKGFSKSVWDFSGVIPRLSGKKGENYPKIHIFTEGNGSVDNPYVIKTSDDFFNIRMSPESSYVLANDIIFPKQPGVSNDLGKGFVPIEEFKGTLDGGGYYIYGFTVSFPEKEYSAIFEKNSGTVKNVTVNMLSAEGKSYAGGIAGANDGVIENVNIINSRIGAKVCSGGVSGSNSGKIISCFVNSDVFSKQCAGGITGENTGIVTKCTKKGGVISSNENGESYAGGIVGENFSVITLCENNGRVMAHAENVRGYAGGISGGNSSETENCFNTGFITAKGKNYAYTGGITGISKSGKITGAYSIGYCISNALNTATGGISGTGSGKIFNCLYDETQSPPAGSGNFQFYKVSPLYGEQAFEFLGTEFVISDFVPFELSKNPHRPDDLKDNIRDFAGGNGTEENPYLIFTPNQLDNVRYYPGSTFSLVSDIDMTAYVNNNGFQPIGGENFAFFGTFLGNGFSIKGLSSESGLFAENHGDIHALNLYMPEITGNQGGFIALVNTGTISDSKVINPSVSAGGFASYGGIVKTNYSTGMVISCFSLGDTEVFGKGVQYGGIAAENYGIMAGCGNLSNIYITSEGYAVSGGITCGNYGTVSDCYNGGNIVLESPSQSVGGGISGSNSGTVLNCISSAGRILAIKSGGILANQITGNVYNCFYLKENGIFDSRAKGLTENEFSDPSNFENFDFETVWSIGSGGFPIPKQFDVDF